MIMNFTDILEACNSDNSSVSIFVGKTAKQSEINKALKGFKTAAAAEGYDTTFFKNIHPHGGGIITVSIRRAKV